MRRLTAPALLALGLVLAPALVAAADPEVARLLERAQFWQSRSRDDLAREELDKVLRLVPDQPDALAQLARMQLRLNQEREAAATYERLRAAHPTHPGTGQIATLLRVRGADRERLRLARQLARAGRGAEAVAAYRAIFPDGIPDDELALEFGQALGGTPTGWEDARRLLAELAKRHPDDPRYQVAIAAHLSTRKPVSAETFRQLRQLSAVPAVSRQANEAWRRAVLAMDVTDDAVPALREYIAANPGETAVHDRLQLVMQELAAGRHAPTPAEDAASRARRQGWAALEAGRLDEAEAHLDEALARNPKDGEAIAGSGVLRMRQGRHAEAVELLERAIAMDKSGKGRWDGLLHTARYWHLLQQARQAREAGKLELAEQRAREALAIDPKGSDAAAELARILVGAGRDRDAEALLAQLAPEQRRPIADAIAEMRAGRLREEAKRLAAQGRDGAAVAALEQAAALDPADPWLRHDLARLYAARGEPQRARALFDDLLARRPRDPDARYAWALVLSSMERETEAMGVLEMIPPAERSANMTRLQHRLWISVQGQRAAALAAGGDRREAERVLARAQAAAGDDREAAIEVARALNRVEADAALREQLDRIAAMKPADPADEATIASLRGAEAMRRARGHRNAGQTAEAAEIYRGLLRADPGQGGPRLELIDTLIERGEGAEARPLVEAALRSDPDEPRALSAAARLAFAEKRMDAAIAYEQRAIAAEGGAETWRYRRLAEWLDDSQGWYSGALDWLARSGTRGKSQVSAQELPVAWRQAWNPGARWFVRVAPARIASGGIDLEDTTEANSFGSALLCLPLCEHGAPSGVETGVALGTGFEVDGWRVDLGSTPIGFPVTNVVGGVARSGRLGPASYTLEAARRPLASSLLSYAGTRDPNTGRTWGGVVQTGARLNLSRDSGGDYGAWGVLGAYRLTGRDVQDNDKAELMAGLYRRVVNEPDRLATIGVTGMLWRFSENAGEYTFGHGGYYSPGKYRSIAFPVTYGWRMPSTSVLLRASVSAAWSENRRAPFFPTDPEMQARAEAMAPTTFVDPFYPGGSQGVSYGRSFAAAGEHQLAPRLFIGARLELERSTNYTPNRFLLYLRYAADGPAARPVALPPEPGLPGFQY